MAKNSILNECEKRKEWIDAGKIVEANENSEKQSCVEKITKGIVGTIVFVSITVFPAPMLIAIFPNGWLTKQFKSSTVPSDR